MLKEPRWAPRGTANLKEGGLMSVSMINNTLREWVFVRVSAKITTGSGGYGSVDTFLTRRVRPEEFYQ